MTGVVRVVAADAGTAAGAAAAAPGGDGARTAAEIERAEARSGDAGDIDGSTQTAGATSDGEGFTALPVVVGGGALALVALGAIGFAAWRRRA